MKTINEIFNSARDGADNVKQIIKVKRALDKCEDELSALLYELGCEFYEGRLCGVTDDEAVQCLYGKIDTLRDRIKKLTAEYNSLNGKVLCEGCGKLTSSDFDFCPFCGTKLFDTVIDEEEEDGECESVIDKFKKLINNTPDEDEFSDDHIFTADDLSSDDDILSAEDTPPADNNSETGK